MRVPLPPGRLERDQRRSCTSPSPRAPSPRPGCGSWTRTAASCGPCAAAPSPTSDDGRTAYELIGTLQEVTEPPPGTTAAAHPRHRRLAALPRGVPAGRGPGAGRGPVHRGGAAGRGVPVHARLLARTGSPSSAWQGDRLTLIGHHGHEPGDEGPFSDMPLDDGLSGRRGRPHRPRRSISPRPEDYRRRFPAAWPLAAALRPPVLGVPAADRRRAHDGRLDGGLHAPGRVHARRALRADHRRPDARPGAGPRRCRRDRTRAHRRPPALDAAHARAARSPAWRWPRGTCPPAAGSRSAATGTT